MVFFGSHKTQGNKKMRKSVIVLKKSACGQIGFFFLFLFKRSVLVFTNEPCKYQIIQDKKHNNNLIT